MQKAWLTAICCLPFPSGLTVSPAFGHTSVAKEVVSISKPEKTFRIGHCSESVFVNAAAKEGDESRTFRTVSLQRRYRAGDDWETSTSFALADRPAAVAVLQLAA